MDAKQLQAVEERWNSPEMCVHPEALKEINGLLKEVRRMRCCGNCERYEVEFDGCGKKQILVYRQQTCEEWEQMIIPNDNGARIGECKKWEEK